MSEEQVNETEQVENETTDEQDDEQDTFSREYVEQLRAEAAENRVKAKEAQEALEASESRYQALAVSHAAGGILSRPDALEWSPEWVNEDGSANIDSIREAATAYAHRHPHAAVVSGDIGQGYRGEATGGVDLAGMLRAGA